MLHETLSARGQNDCDMLVGQARRVIGWSTMRRCCRGIQLPGIGIGIGVVWCGAAIAHTAALAAPLFTVRTVVEQLTGDGCPQQCMQGRVVHGVTQQQADMSVLWILDL